jgi:hypothetical protein
VPVERAQDEKAVNDALGITNRDGIAEESPAKETARTRRRPQTGRRGLAPKRDRCAHLDRSSSGSLSCVADAAISPGYLPAGDPVTTPSKSLLQFC